MHLAAFTLVDNANVSATLTLIKGRPLDPQALRKKLAAAGIPAVVTNGRRCDNQDNDSAKLDRVIAPQRLADGTVILVITPSAMPAGCELSIGVFPHGKISALVTAGAALRCSHPS